MFLTTFLKSCGGKFLPPPPQPRGANEIKAIRTNPTASLAVCMVKTSFEGEGNQLAKLNVLNRIHITRPQHGQEVRCHVYPRLSYLAKNCALPNYNQL